MLEGEIKFNHSKKKKKKQSLTNQHLLTGEKQEGTTIVYYLHMLLAFLTNYRSDWLNCFGSECRNNYMGICIYLFRISLLNIYIKNPQMLFEELRSIIIFYYFVSVFPSKDGLMTFRDLVFPDKRLLLLEFINSPDDDFNYLESMVLKQKPQICFCWAYEVFFQYLFSCYLKGFFCFFWFYATFFISQCSSYSFSFLPCLCSWVLFLFLLFCI